jgi:hypothetical protein
MSAVGPGILGFWGPVGGFAVVVSASLAVLLVGLFLHVTLVDPARNDPRLYVRRRFMCWFGVVGFVIGWGYYIEIVDERTTAKTLALTNPVTGLLLGAMVGNLVGRAVWLALRPAETPAP